MSGEVLSGAGSEAEALEGFIAKWRARWPEWSVAEVFVPREQRETARAWASLLHELTLAAWGGVEARPGELKLAWWQEELVGWSKGARRHPLGLVLQRRQAPWARLAVGLPALQASRERPGDTGEAFVDIAPFCDGVVAVEGVLFAPADALLESTRRGAGAETAQHEQAVALVTATLLHSRFLYDSDSLVPLQVLARSGSPSHAARAAWARELLQCWPIEGSPGPRVRRIWAALARARLERPDPAAPLPPLAALRAAWRVARN
ncbi:MAG: phytoene/squalene synthase family protein [Pseudomonadota bacterium]|nr:phytoene/squalene synthase family protein [Pseudomonadota bacterium]